MYIKTVPPPATLSLQRGTPALQSSPGTAPSSTAASTANSINRLGLPLEQRADVRRLLELLQRRVDQGGKDLRGAVAEVALLEETNRLLAGRLSEVQFQLEGGKSTREVELEREAAEVGAVCLCTCWNNRTLVGRVML